MKSKNAKNLAPQEQVQPKIEYTEVDFRGFKREMTMVFLQLKGEFSPQRTVNATDSLSITQDMLMPSVKNVDNLELVVPISTAVDLKKVDVVSVNKSLDLKREFVILKPMVMTKCDNEITYKGAELLNNITTVRVYEAKVVPTAQLTTIVLNIKVNSLGRNICIPKRLDKPERGHISLIHMTLDNCTHLTGIHNYSAFAFGKAIISNSISWECIIKCLTSLFIPIAEIQAQNVADTFTNDRIVSNSSIAGNLAKSRFTTTKIQLQNIIKSELTIPIEIGIKRSTKIFSVDIRAEEYGKVNIQDQGYVPKIIQTEINSDFTDLLSGFKNFKNVKIVIGIPSVRISSVDIYRITHVNGYSLLSDDVVSSRINMPKEPNIKCFSGDSKGKLHPYKSVFDGKIIDVSVKDFFDVEICNEFDFSIDVVRDSAYDGLTSLSTSCLLEGSDLTNGVIIPKPVISVNKKRAPLNTKGRTKIRIPYFSNDVGNLVDSFDIDEIRSISVPISTSVYCDVVSTQVGGGQKLIDMQLCSSTDAIWVEAENVFDYYRQLVGINIQGDLDEEKVAIDN